MLTCQIMTTFYDDGKVYIQFQINNTSVLTKNFALCFQVFLKLAQYTLGAIYGCV